MLQAYNDLVKKYKEAEKLAKSAPQEIKAKQVVEEKVVKTAAELEDALDEALICEDPIFLDVQSEPEVEHLPPVYSWLQAAEGEKD